eukprot:CAMPEP_0119389576 /NCGR_PEP_ID=MMETSP1334-20130426/110016_1 /TAXON_ID=127549 /ORGANISM="Calcidiscus leptoporus, Strain RCC1130" /LENGTH=37 /DNA_ID= /DNA_START= /DNA_END= /DNA_ORIENTATION=
MMMIPEAPPPTCTIALPWPCGWYQAMPDSWLAGSLYT